MPRTQEEALLKEWFPFTSAPLIIGAPMRTISGPELVAAVGEAGGLGFLGAGYTVDNLESELKQCRALLSSTTTPSPVPNEPLPISMGVGFILWACPLPPVITALTAQPVSALWLFAPNTKTSSPPTTTLSHWLSTLYTHLPKPLPKIFFQTSSLTEARNALLQTNPSIDVLVVQGTSDSGGHGSRHSSASIMTLLPETADLIAELKSTNQIPKDRLIPIVAAGGIMDARGVAAAMALGAHAITLGTTLIATPESLAPEGFRRLLIETSDGARNTIRTRLYDELRGTGGWPDEYGGRAVLNKSYMEWEGFVGRSAGEGRITKMGSGVEWEELKRKYEQAEREGDFSRLTVFAGTGVGLIREVRPAGQIVRDAREGAKKILAGFSAES